MKSTIVLVIVCAVAMVAFFPQSVFPLKCVICDNNKDTDCGHGAEVKSEKYTKDCSEVAAADGVQGTTFEICRKIVTWIDFAVNNNTATERIVRKCGHIDSKYNTECYYRGGFGGRQRVCSCLTDNCNSGFTFQVNHIVLAVASLMALTVARF